MNHNQLKAYWQSEQDHAFSGWDFAYIEDRYESDPLPWDYRAVIEEFRHDSDNLLDMGTGGGEFLLQLNHPFEKTTVTEAYPPNAALCREKLAPLGITVVEADCEQALPFVDGTFDLVINRHESFVLSEIHRILKPGGIFITQQVGGRNNTNLSKRLLGNAYEHAYPHHCLDQYLHVLCDLRFELLRAEENFSEMRFYDAGALAYYAKIIEWEFPGFSVETHFDRLLDCHREILQNGYVSGTEHRFLMAARKRC